MVSVEMHGIYKKNLDPFYYHDCLEEESDISGYIWYWDLELKLMTDKITNTDPFDLIIKLWRF